MHYIKVYPHDIVAEKGETNTLVFMIENFYEISL